MIKELEEALLLLDRIKVNRIISKIIKLDRKINIIDRVIVPIMDRIGTGWEDGTVSLSQVYISGRICEDIVNSLLPDNRNANDNPSKLAVFVYEDYHLLGKRIIYSTLKACGYNITDFGRQGREEVLINVPVKDYNILLISTLMLSSAIHLKETIYKIRCENPDIKIIVGGAPFRFDDFLWKEIGADAMGRNSSEAIVIVDELSKVLEITQ